MLTDKVEDLKAGFASIDFTPAEPVPLGGYGGIKERLSTHVKDPLYVRAVALSQGDNLVVLLSYDLLIVFEDIYQGLRSRLVDVAPKLMVHATHTHSSVGGFWNTFLGRRFLGDYRPWMSRHLIDAGERAARNAIADLAPAKAFTNVGILPGLNGNRRDPNGVKDEELTVLRLVRDKDDAVLWSYSAHPVIVAERDFHAVSADFPGQVNSLLARNHSFSMFVQGSLGGVDVLFPQDPEMTAEKNLELMAQPLANAVTTLAKGALPTKGRLQFSCEQWEAGRPDVRPFFEDQKFKRALDFPLRKAANLLLAPVSNKARVCGFRYGDFALLGFPADLGVGIGLAVKQYAQELGIESPVAASQTNGYLGYLHRRADYLRAPSQQDMAIYENAMSFFGRDTGEQVLEAAKRVLDQLV